jgi:hypothetical protein
VNDDMTSASALNTCSKQQKQKQMGNAKSAIRTYQTNIAIPFYTGTLTPANTHSPHAKQTAQRKAHTGASAGSVGAPARSANTITDSAALSAPMRCAKKAACALRSAAEAPNRTAIARM